MPELDKKTDGILKNNKKQISTFSVIAIIGFIVFLSITVEQAAEFAPHTLGEMAHIKGNKGEIYLPFTSAKNGHDKSFKHTTSLFTANWKKNTLANF